MVSRNINSLLMEDQDNLDVLFGSIAESVNENYFWIFGSNPICVVSQAAPCKLIEKIDDIDDDDIMINSPLKSSSVIKFKRPIKNFGGKVIKITPRALISKMTYLVGSSNKFGAAIIDNSIIKKMADLITSKSITISMWFKIEDDCTGGVLFGVQNREFSTGDAFVPVIYLSHNLELRATFWGEKLRALVCSDKSMKTCRKWQHLSFTKARNEQKLYLNGKLVDSSSTSRFTHHDHKLYFGQLGSGLCDRWPNTNMNYSSNCYTLAGGKIADVCMLDSALNEEELKQLMINPKTFPLIAHWDFIQDNDVKIVGNNVITIGTDFMNFVN